MNEQDNNTQSHISTPQRSTVRGERCRVHITVEGIVQGVGFRPFVNRVAKECGLAGSAHNFTGGVSIEIEGHRDDVDRFVDELRENAPPISVIDSIEVEKREPTGQQGFVIEESDADASGPVYVSPDVAVCSDCVAEMRDPDDQRARYPFINCTNCGPRFTIIRDMPYDRPFTSMAEFEMCEDCRRQYEDIDDRRYHAQPVACPDCGPRVELKGPASGGPDSRESLYRAEAVERTQKLLADGKIVAIKGLGGFHLACDAEDEWAVAELRRRKFRDEKPFAVMAASLEVASNIAHITEDAAELLQSPQSPIVLARKSAGQPLAESVAVDSADYGIMLPYTPLHILLFNDADYSVLVMTSGNLSGEPLCTKNDEAMRRLDGIADAFLINDREILTGCDDSVVRLSAHGPIIMRRARGYVPFPVKLDEPVEAVFAVGGQLKNTFCLTRNEDAFLSQHIGDLNNLQTLDFFKHSVEHLQDILRIEPEVIATDLHPDYLSTRHAQQVAAERELPVIEVQHHHAHIASCMADNGVSEPVVGIACDGTGLGPDGTVWGCEVIRCDMTDFERLGHLQYAPLPGGDVAVREPWRMALSYLCSVGYADRLDWLWEQLQGEIERAEFDTVRAMIDSGLNCTRASSAGRLFDAVAALVGLRLRATYEGQPAIALEAAAEPASQRYPYHVYREDSNWVMDPKAILGGVIDDVRNGVGVGQIAAKFHDAFAHILADCACRAAEATRISTIALSGGTFQNRILLSHLSDILIERGLQPLRHRDVPPNDGGLSLGQAVIASAKSTTREV